MKKILTLAAAAVISLSAAAQGQKALAQSKFSDNWYIGINGGAQTKTTNNAWMKNLNPQAGLRIGKWISPVFGITAEGNVTFDNKANGYHFHAGKGNFVKELNVMGVANVNLSNLFCGYAGQPRTFELIANYGLGWQHNFQAGAKFSDEAEALVSKVAVDFAVNFGSDKQWQFYVEPALVYALSSEMPTSSYCKYNLNQSVFQLTAGINYKFGNSNGTHNFALVDVRDQAEIDGLNGKINDLRGQLNGKDSEIARLKKALADCENKPAPQPQVIEVKKDPMQTNLMPKVIFKVGQSTVDGSQIANVEMIAKYMKSNPDAKVLVKGYASPEGNAERNQILSEKRAQATADMLVKKFGIAADRITVEGCGPTSELSDVLDFNRVATFADTTKE